jgi:hypothetical protein
MLYLILFLVTLVFLLLIYLLKLEKKITFLINEQTLIKQRLVDIDPQFDDERLLIEGLKESIQKGETTLLGASHADLVRKKERDGKPTIFNPF